MTRTRKNQPVVNLRSTNGGGKSHCVYGLFKHFGRVRIVNKKTRQVLGYRLKGTNVVVIGRYETDCGGCDQIKTQDEVCERVRHFAKKYAVLFEGLLISGLYSRYLDLSNELGGVIWAYLDTPIDVCFKHVAARRRASGKDDTLTDKTKQNVTSKYNAVERSRVRAIEDQQKVVMVDHKKSAKQVARLLNIGW